MFYSTSTLKYIQRKENGTALFFKNLRPGVKELGTKGKPNESFMKFKK